MSRCAQPVSPYSLGFRVGMKVACNTLSMNGVSGVRQRRENEMYNHKGCEECHQKVPSDYGSMCKKCIARAWDYAEIGRVPINPADDLHRYSNAFIAAVQRMIKANASGSA